MPGGVPGPGPGPHFGPGSGPGPGPEPGFWVRDGSGRPQGSGPGRVQVPESGSRADKTVSLVGFGRFSTKKGLFGPNRDLKCAFSKATVWVSQAREMLFLLCLVLKWRRRGIEKGQHKEIETL